MFPNRMLTGAALLACVAWAAPVHAQKIVVLPDDTWARDVTPDGSVVVGTSNVAASNADGFLWRWKEEPAPTIFPGVDVVAVSDDGTVLAGNVYDPALDRTVAARWTAATGWQSLGWLPNALSCSDPNDPSVAYGISGDGSTIVGLSWDGCSGRGFRWTAATGMQELQKLTTGANRCSAIAGNGSVMGGFAFGGFGSRTPAYWTADTAGYVLDPDFSGEVLGFSENGVLSVGTMYFSGPAFSAFVRNTQTGVLKNLGKLNPTWAGQAWDISEDGTTVVGFDFYLGARKAWLWTQTGGIVSLKDQLTALGVANVPDLWTALKCSDDGNVIVGGGATSTKIVGYIAELSSAPSPWTSLGHALPGSLGIPKLKGTGTLAVGQPLTLNLTNAKKNSSALLFLGLSAINAPFKQGTLVPSPDLPPIGLQLSAAGAAALQFTWPAGVPSGLETFWQAWIVDPAGPAGAAASNALKSVAP